MIDWRERKRVFADWQHEAGPIYAVAFVAAAVVFAASFTAGFVKSFGLFGIPSISSDAAVLGRDLFARSDFGPALDEFRMAGLLDPENYDSSPALDFGQPQGDAVALLRRQRQLVEQGSHDAAAHLRLGQALQAAGEAGAAASSFERARDLDPHLPGLSASLGSVYLVEGRFDEAVLILREAVAAAPSLPILHDKLGLALYQAGERDEARREFARARALREGGAGSTR